MNFLKSESYSLSPDEYLEKFRNPHQIISAKGDAEMDKKDLAILNPILVRYYDDSQEGAALKQRIVSELTAVVKQWMTKIAEQQKKQIDFDKLGYGLKVFGSYRLKTNSHDGDIDMVCIVPQFISRERHFFQMLANNFRKLQHAREIYSIPDAIVPLMRLTFYGIQIDLLLSIIHQSFIGKYPHFIEGDTTIDHNLPINPQELRNINGYRTAIHLEKNYAEKYKNYRVALKAIKLWAKLKGIYSQIFGYLGGAGFSIMLAKIFQLYPNYSSLQLLDRFFFIYANWVWSIPVVIEKTKSLERPLDSQMVILTPLEPHMNAGHYISKFTYNVTRKQFRIASKLIQQINKQQTNKKQNIKEGKHTWDQLFTPFNFFNYYGNFVEISVMGDKIDEFVRWKGNVESKIRKLIQNLEQVSDLNAHGMEVNPYPRAFPSKHHSFKHCSKYYIGIKCSTATQIDDIFEIDITQPVRSFLELLENYAEIDKVPKEISIGVTHISRKDISHDVIDSFNKSFIPK